MVVDVETGGLKYKEHAITQIAVVVVDGKTLEIKEQYSTYVANYGGLTYDQQALDYTHITLRDIETKGINVKIVVEQMIDMAKRYKTGKYGLPIFVGHNFAKFDRDFIANMFAFCGKNEKDFFDVYCEDTLRMSENCWPDMPKHKLSFCCQAAGVELLDAHDALNDTVATAQLFVYLSRRLRNSEVTNQSSSSTTVRKKIQFEIQ
jgi:DNA polymerase III epsilon subunit-like protein